MIISINWPIKNSHYKWPLTNQNSPTAFAISGMPTTPKKTMVANTHSQSLDTYGIDDSPLSDSSLDELTKTPFPYNYYYLSPVVSKLPTNNEKKKSHQKYSFYI